jgi:penicillin amidase
MDGRLTQSGFPMIANDPHLSLTAPPVFYEAHLTVTNDPVRGPMNVAGVTFAGAPGIAQGCNDRICWGSTINPMDVTDVYRERILLALGFIPRSTIFDGREEPLVILQQSFRVNQRSNGVVDDIVPVSVGPLEGGATLIVPRRNNGPIVAIDISNPQEITGLSVQYAGFGPTRELDATLGFARARNLQEFRQALQFFDVGSQNFGYADVDGNIAYFTSGELPLREDLETLGRVDGMPPFLIRDGTHRFRNEWLPVANRQTAQAVEAEILPFDEMPQWVNPSQGFIVNTNQDPVGVTLDNDPLNSKRTTGGVYYLNPGFAGGFRQGRLVGLIRDVQAKGEKMSLGMMAGIQANHQMLDAQIFTPHLVSAWRNAQAPGAPPPLAALAADRGIAEAIARLRIWDFSTPTGIPEGWDPGDEAESMPGLTHDHVQNSISATLYSVWRGQVVRSTIDAGLTRLGLGGALPPDDQSLAALRVLLESWPERRGRGFSGIDFFEVPGVASRDAARDILLLQSMRQALDLLAGDAFAPTFNHSRLQDDYRWGKLHRVVFSHPAGSGFSIPPAGAFEHLGPALRGIPRSGGFETVDASNHSVRAASVDAFMFGSGPARRFVAEMTPSGPRAFQVIAGGQNGNPASPQDGGLLRLWLGNRFHPLLAPAGQPQQTFRTTLRRIAR